MGLRTVRWHRTRLPTRVYGTPHSTKAAYATGVRQFNAFCQDHQAPHLPRRTVAHFVAHLSLRGLAPATIGLYTSAVGSLHRQLGLPDPCRHNHILTLAKRGAAKSHSRPQPTRAPTTPSILRHLLRTLRRSHDLPRRDRRMLAAALTTAFHGFLRVSEFTAPSATAFNPQRHATATDISWHRRHFTLYLKFSKSDQRGHGTRISLPRSKRPTCPQTATCPHTAMARYRRGRSITMTPAQFSTQATPDGDRQRGTSTAKEGDRQCGTSKARGGGGPPARHIQGQEGGPPARHLRGPGGGSPARHLQDQGGGPPARHIQGQEGGPPARHLRGPGGGSPARHLQDQGGGPPARHLQDHGTAPLARHLHGHRLTHLEPGPVTSPSVIHFPQSYTHTDISIHISVTHYLRYQHSNLSYAILWLHPFIASTAPPRPGRGTASAAPPRPRNGTPSAAPPRSQTISPLTRSRNPNQHSIYALRTISALKSQLCTIYGFTHSLHGFTHSLPVLRLVFPHGGCMLAPGLLYVSLSVTLPCHQFCKAAHLRNSLPRSVAQAFSWGFPWAVPSRAVLTGLSSYAEAGRLDAQSRCPLALKRPIASVATSARAGIN